MLVGDAPGASCDDHHPREALAQPGYGDDADVKDVAARLEQLTRDRESERRRPVASARVAVAEVATLECAVEKE